MSVEATIDDPQRRGLVHEAVRHWRGQLIDLGGRNTLLYYREGPTGIVTVKRLTGVRSLAIDGKVDASTGGDMLTQKTLAHLPLLLHGAARKVAIIGLGLDGALPWPRRCRWRRGCRALGTRRRDRHGRSDRSGK